MLGRYILVDRKPVLYEGADKLTAWMEWYEDIDNRRVGDTMVGEIRVSTVFLGYDHNWDDEGPPTLFESMAFFRHDDEWQERCCAWEEAEQMHEDMVMAVRAL